MTARELLAQVRELDEAVDKKAEKIRIFKDMATRVGGTIDGMPRSPSPNLQHMESFVAIYTDLKEELDIETDKLIDLKMQVAAALTSYLNDTQHIEVLKLRCLDLLTQSETAEAMRRSERRVRQLECEAISQFEAAWEARGEYYVTI